MTQLCWTQSSITLENDDAQKVLYKLKMGDYYETMFRLNTERISVLEATIENMAQEINTKDLLNETLRERVSISEEEIKALERRYKDAEKDWSKSKTKTVLVVGILGFVLGSVLMAGVAL